MLVKEIIGWYKRNRSACRRAHGTLVVSSHDPRSLVIDLQRSQPKTALEIVLDDDCARQLAQDIQQLLERRRHVPA